MSSRGNRTARTHSSLAGCLWILSKAPLHASVSPVWNVTPNITCPPERVWGSPAWGKHLRSPVVTGSRIGASQTEQRQRKPAVPAGTGCKGVWCGRPRFVPALTRFRRTKRVTAGSHRPLHGNPQPLLLPLWVHPTDRPMWWDACAAADGTISPSSSSSSPGLKKGGVCPDGKGKRELGVQASSAHPSGEHNLPTEHQASNILVGPDAHGAVSFSVFSWFSSECQEAEFSSSESCASDGDFCLFVWGQGMVDSCSGKVCPWERRSVWRDLGMSWASGKRKSLLRKGWILFL